MAEATPVVSVIVPAHDAEAELGRALRSALAQTMAALEVVVVDDASGDATAEIAEAAARGDARVRVVRAARNLGPAGARNLGLDAARGEWIALLDSDDAYLPRRLERLLALARDTGADMVADNLLLRTQGTDADEQPMLPPDLLDRPRRVDAADFLIGNLPVRGRPRVSYGFLKPMFRRAFLDRRRLRYDPRLRFAEDFDLYLKCLIAGARFWLTPDAGYAYAVRDGSITARHTARDLLRLRAVDRRLLRHAGAGAEPRLRDALRRHLRSIDRRLIWRLFTDALKRGDWRRAWRTGTASPRATLLVLTGLWRAIPHRLRRTWHRPLPAKAGR